MSRLERRKHKEALGAPAIHIRAEHQSAPKEHWADKQITLAAEEISEGRYIPSSIDHDADPLRRETVENMGLALDAGMRRKGRGQAKTFSEMQQAAIETRDMNQLSYHPRVVEAMEKLQKEVDDRKTPEQIIERQWRMHEMMSTRAEAFKWKGQERWLVKDAEEMRKGELLGPMQFMKRLTDVIGTDRIKMSHNIVKTTKDAKSGRMGLYIPNPRWRGQLATTYAAETAEHLATEGRDKALKAKALRAIGQESQADRMIKESGDMAQASMKILIDDRVEEQTEPPYLRCGTLQPGYNTEWMIMAFDRYGVPTTAKYLGWRTALLTMMRCRVITEKEAHSAFPVGSGSVADWYLEQLQMFRNTGVGAV